MKARNVLITAGVVAVGAFLVYHVRRGGRLTLSSLGDSLGDLLGRTKHKAGELKDDAERAVVHDIATNVAKATELPPD